MYTYFILGFCLSQRCHTFSHTSARWFIRSFFHAGALYIWCCRLDWISCLAYTLFVGCYSILCCTAFCLFFRVPNESWAIQYVIMYDHINIQLRLPKILKKKLEKSPYIKLVVVPERAEIRVCRVFSWVLCRAIQKKYSRITERMSMW